MPAKETWEERFVRDKKKTLKKVDNVRMEIKGDRTIININALGKEYKLAQAYANLRNLEFRAKEEIKLQTYADYLEIMKNRLKLKFTFEEKPRPKFPADEAYRDKKSTMHYPHGSMLVLVDSDIYEDVAKSVDQYVLDVGRDGYWATVYVVKGGTPANVRSFIKQKKPVGALLVGAVAAPWFEMDNDFHGVHSEFPCDLYYMDTNGTWSDPDNDGMFSGHNGNLDPEIWIGRLWTPTKSGNDASLINDYFRRNHQFRLGLLGHARSALAFVDDDWQGFDDCGFDQMFPSSVITKYTNPVITDSDLYKFEVNSLRSWVQLCAHSSVHSHALRVGAVNEHIYTDYFRDTNPPNSHFYNLFCCGPGKYTSNDYLAGWYIFDKKGGGKNLGLAAIASAKSGSMLLFEDFYRPMGQRKVIGDAFVEWWKARGPDHDDGEKRWYYGLVLLGDPTLSWWKGAVPQPMQPQPDDVFDHYPRKTRFMWEPVNLPNVKYTLEIDAFHAVNAGKWAEETNQTFMMRHNITGNTFVHNFVGMQRGRWRVRAKVNGTFCSWSPWSYFKYTI